MAEQSEPFTVIGRTLFPVGTTVTVRLVLPEITPKVAVTVEVPGVTAVARPLGLTVATDGLDELQVVTCVVISRLVPSENLPKAVSCKPSPEGSLGLAGAKDMDDSVVTVRVVVPAIPPETALMVVVPAATAVARPLLFTVATDVFAELQET